jgi:protein arginine N-methyltransferase 1
MMSDLEFHAFCLTRTGTRLDQFAKAIRRHVTRGDVVVDLGAGSGILSFLACQAGAARVYAIEAGDSIAFARQLAATMGLQQRIEFIGKPSTQVVLPERARVIVSDIHDTFGLQQNGLSAFIDARERFLEPDGSLIPRSIQLMIVPVEAREQYQHTVDVWQQRIHGVDLSPLRMLAVNQPSPSRVEPGQLLAAPAPIATIDLAQAQTAYAGGTAVVDVTRHGSMHGLCGCFVTTLAEGVTMGNVPGDSSTTHFAQAFFPIDTPLDVVPGDRISIRIDTHDSIAARWQVDVVRAGASIARFDHATPYAASLSMETLRKQAADYRPRLTPRGAAERALLDRFDGVRPASELEAWLSERFKDVFPSRSDAAALLKSTIDRCG